MTLSHLHYGQAGKRSRRGLSKPAKMILTILVFSGITLLMFVAANWLLPRQADIYPLREPQFKRHNDGILFKPYYKSVREMIGR